MNKKNQDATIRTWHYNECSADELRSGVHLGQTKRILLGRYTGKANKERSEWR